MTEEELKNKCKERAKIFQQAMESCKSSSLMDCIEWFADRIAELEKENAELKDKLDKIERKCRFNFVDLLHDVENESKQEEQLTKAKEIIKMVAESGNGYSTWQEVVSKAEQFLKEVEKCGQ